MSNLTEEHKAYLGNTDITFNDKKNYYMKFAEDLSLFPDQREASVIWSKITAALTYITTLDGQEKNIIRNMFIADLRGNTSAAEVFKRFELEKGRGIDVLKTFLNVHSIKDIVHTRELAFAFIAETQGDLLYERIYNIAEGVYVDSSAKHTNKEAKRLAYERFVQLTKNPLVSPQDQDAYITRAREVYLSDESRD